MLVDGLTLVGRQIHLLSFMDRGLNIDTKKAKQVF